MPGDRSKLRLRFGESLHAPTNDAGPRPSEPADVPRFAETVGRTPDLPPDKPPTAPGSR